VKNTPALNTEEMQFITSGAENAEFICRKRWWYLLILFGCGKINIKNMRK
jgi:hypothetical protein